MKKYANLKVLLSLATLLVFLMPQQSIAARDNTGVADFVKWAFADAPDMITIAQCESGIRQYSSPDVPVRGGGRYIGIFQIDEVLHKKRAISLGYDIYSPEGNVAYARYMYNASGTNPWKGCLKKPSSPVVAAAINPTVAAATIGGTLTMNLQMGMNNPQVVLLQKILNKSGYVVAAGGAGSVGHETTTFGSLTREAVKKFQCKQLAICSGSESTNGYGKVGPMTRAALNKISQ